MSVLKWVLVFVLQLPVSGLFVQSLLVLDDQPPASCIQRADF